MKKELADYVNEHISVYLPDKELECITIPNPIPQNVIVEREMDAYIAAELNASSDNVETKAQKTYLKDKEKTLTSVQARVGMILDPLTKLSSIFDAASMEKAKELNCEEVMETIKKTVIMTSQAVNYITHQRRWNAISAYNKTERGIGDLLRKYSKDLSASHRNTKKIEAALKKQSSRSKQDNRNPKSKKPFLVTGETETTHTRGTNRNLLCPIPAEEAPTTTESGMTTRQATENQVSMSHQVNQTREIYLNIPSLLPTLNSVQVNMDLVHPVIKNLLKYITGQLPLAGRVKIFLQNWEKLTRDQNILEIVQGWKIPLLAQPYERANPRRVDISGGLGHAKKGAITPVKNHPKHFLSNLSITPKKDGRVRPVVNLRQLNRAIPYQKDGNNAEPERGFAKGRSHDKSRSTRRILLNPTPPRIPTCSTISVEEDTVSMPLPLLWNWSSPQNFYQNTKNSNISSEAVEHKTEYYLFGRYDNHSTNREGNNNFLLQQLRFIINLKKSTLTPTTSLEFLGIWTKSVQFTMKSPKEKAKTLIQKCKEIFKSKMISLRKLSSIIGTLVSTAPAVFPAPLQYRYLQKQ